MLEIESEVIWRYIRNAAWRTVSIARSDASLYLFIGIYTATGLGFLAWVGALHRTAYQTYVPIWLMVFGFVLPAVSLLLETGWLLHRFERRRKFAAGKMFSAERMAVLFSGICLLMGIMIFQSTFTSVKNGMSVLRKGFPYDRALADIDAYLHFGTDPWRWLYVIGKHDWVRESVGWNYDMLWFIICYSMLFFMVTSPRTTHLKRRYVLSFMVVWVVVGNILAGLFMSAGPAFYGYVTGDVPRFGEQLSFLAQSPSASSAAVYQQYLWTLQTEGVTGLASGISAFPSVHVALITLNAVYTWEYDQRLGAIAFLYVAFIVASSVYLGWHYAIDGYAAVALTIALCAAVRKLVPDGEILMPGPARQSAAGGSRPEAAVTVS
ncbi:phosphatase PAP2 family protein [Mesorhizobium sp. M0025]|uniref:phosphatase PAP2 family protein n=1 Tax=Mesorhizobium sp. M0025 TaxID=2956846 RepID=UPI0033353923